MTGGLTRAHIVHLHSMDACANRKAISALLVSDSCGGGSDQDRTRVIFWVDTSGGGESLSCDVDAMGVMSSSDSGSSIGLVC